MPAAATTTRDAILDQAVHLASTDGLEGLTIGRLATQMQMSKSGLFAHFGSKEELQLATVQEAAQRFIAEVIEPALDEPEGAARLRAYCERNLAHLERPAYRGGCFWGATAPEFDDRPGPVHDAVRGAVEAWLKELERQAAIAGVEAPDQLAFEVYSLVQGANVARRLLGDDSAFERARTAIERRLPR
jgi:AcrR family transcriptional regulator